MTVTASRTFTSLTWDDTQTFTVSGTDDAVETAESYTATISHTASSSDPLFDGAAPLFFPSSEVFLTTLELVKTMQLWPPWPYRAVKTLRWLWGLKFKTLVHNCIARTRTRY